MNIQKIIKPELRDISSSIAVFLVAIPLCLGIAHASGTPLLSGIIAGVIGGIVVGFISSSHLSVSGPAAGLTGVVLASITELNSFEAFLTALVLAGIIQILLGALKAGIFSNYIPFAVLKGLLTAIGIVLILKQFPHLIGYDIEQFGVEEFALTPQDMEDPTRKESNTLTTFIHSLEHIHTGVLSIGIICSAALVFWEKKIYPKFKLIPGSLLIVLIGIAINELFKSYFPNLSLEKEHLVQIPIIQNLQAVSYTLNFPDFSALNNPTTYKIAVSIAFIASIETLLSIEAIDKIDPEKVSTPANRELIAQGTGNIISGLLGGLPITSVIVRSTVNLNSGARTKFSTIFHGFWLALSFLLIPNFINKIPLTTLAVVLCYSGIKLAHPKIFRELYRQGLDQFFLFLITAIAIVFTDLLIGIIIGSFFAFLFILIDVFKSPVVKVLHGSRFTKIFLGENLTYLHKSKIRQALLGVKENSRVLVDGRKCVYVHKEIIELLEDFVEHARSINVQLSIQGLRQMNYDSSQAVDRDSTLYLKLLEDNKDWVWEKLQENNSYFENLAKGQNPDFLIIGCSDSRVPVNILTKADPGLIFVHRNISNLVRLDDINLMSALEYSVTVLKVKQIIVLGHYNCGGVKAAMGECSGYVGEWIEPIREVLEKNRRTLDTITDPNEQWKKLVDLNVIAQTETLKNINFIQKSIVETGYPLIHGWVYNMHTGLILELN